jgi:hypothetical protein
MPKRSNDFQRLILAIHSSLIPLGAVITESKMIETKDGSGTPSEVDIVIESNHSATTIVVGVECTAKTRPATKEWVDQMIGKHKDLKLDKTILVSKNGFTTEAQKKAIKYGFMPISLTEAEKIEWNDFLIRIKVLTVAISRLQAIPDTQVLVDFGASLPEGANLKNEYIYDMHGKKICRLSEVSQILVRDIMDVDESRRPKNNDILEIDYFFERGEKLIMRKKDIPVKRIRGRFKFIEKQESMNMTPINYGDAKVAYATKEVLNKKFTSILGQQDQNVTFQVDIDDIVK